MKNLLSDLLQQLIGIPSVNPMGNPPDQNSLETQLTEFLETELTRQGVACQRHEVHPGRDNLLAHLPGQTDRLLLLEAHQDTVPVTGMTIDPFGGELREGRVYGRGACDVKGGMAAMIGAMVRLAKLPSQARPTVVLACTINEEYGFTGARTLVEHWSTGRDRWLPRAPDAAIVAEPTELQVVVAHKGIVRWHCQTQGQAAHASQPQAGDNAIYRMARVVEALECYAAQLTASQAAHRRCGQPTLSVTTIQGGESVNTIPDACTIEIERRLLPREDPQQAYQEVLQAIDERLGPDPLIVHRRPYCQGPGLDDEANRTLAEALASEASRTGQASQLIGATYGTDAAWFAKAGVPTVVFGPGSIDQAHTVDEWVSLAEVEQASDIYYRFAKSFIV